MGIAKLIPHAPPEAADIRTRLLAFTPMIAVS